MSKTGFRRKNQDKADCKQCGKSFVKKIWNQVFCSVACKNDWHNDQTSRVISEYWAAKEAGKI
jgi:ribosomal protein L37AE/L43A